MRISFLVTLFCFCTYKCWNIIFRYVSNKYYFPEYCMYEKQIWQSRKKKFIPAVYYAHFLSLKVICVSNFCRKWKCLGFIFIWKEVLYFLHDSQTHILFIFFILPSEVKLIGCLYFKYSCCRVILIYGNIFCFAPLQTLIHMCWWRSFASNKKHKLKICFANIKIVWLDII